MKRKMTIREKNKYCQALTIIEMSIVLAILLGLTGIISMSMGGVTRWQLAKNAGEDLRVVYIAQKTFLADHPTNSPSDFTTVNLLPYLPSGTVANQSVELEDGSSVPIDFSVMPPVLTGFSDDNTEDGLWDVGKP